MIKFTKLISCLLALLLLTQTVGIAALAHEEQHTQTVDEALLADYLSGNLQYLTMGENEQVLYDGKPITFHPPTEGDLRPEQQAVLMKGFENTSPLIMPAAAGMPGSVQIRNNGRISTTNDAGYLSWGDYFTLIIDGVETYAFCLDRNLPGTGSGAPISVNPLTNVNVARTMFFGWDGGSNICLFGGDKARGIISTSIVLTYFIVGGQSPSTSGIAAVRNLYATVRSSNEVPHGSFSVNRNNLNVTLQGNRQVSQSVTFSAFSQNTFQINVPAPLTLVNESRSAGTVIGPGTATVRANETIRFEAPLTHSGTWQSNQIRGSMPEFAPIVARTSSGFQDVGALWSFDPIGTVQLSVEWIDPTGSLRIVKTVEHWHTRAGFEFEVRRVSDNHLVGRFTSPTSGEIYIPNLIPGDYTIREIVPPGFVAPTPNPRTVTVIPGRVANAAPSTTFNNIRQRGTITVTKLDRDTGDRAQGDATLNGAIFDVYNAAGTRVATLNTGNTNTATSQPLPLGVYYVVERVEPHGYTLNPNRHRVVLTYFAPHVAIGNEDVTVYNRVIQGRVAIVKFSDAPDPNNPQIMRPLEGAVFEVFLTSAGSFANALPTERALITTDGNGFAETPLLPFGRYTVREIYAPGDVRLVDPFEVVVDEDGRTYHFILNNPTFMSLVRVVKVDATTGERIPTAGVEFRVWDVGNQQWVEQRINYPTPITISTFRTDETGQLVMPLPLPSGYYELHEISAPYGYILSDEPLPFRIHSSLAGDDDVIEVVFANDPAMGIISIEKRGNMLTGVMTSDTQFGVQHTPVFSLTGLPGAVFNIIAAEDIITPDGTVRHEAGEIVDTITTDEYGRAESRPLFLGSYYVVEQTAPEGFVLDDTPHLVTLVYADQYTPIVHEFLSLVNERQHVSIELEKWMELLDGQTAPFGDVIFGLFADENIYAIDGELVIETGDLVALITLDDNGRGVLELELPWASFVVRELQTATGYLLCEVAFEFSVEPTEQEVAVITVEVNDGEAFRNYLMRGDLRVIKTFEGRDYPVAGVPFLIVGYTVVGVRVEIHAETDENGEIALEDLPIGGWTVTELAGDANIGFVLSPTQTVIITTDEIAELEIHNYRIRGDIRIVKVCAVTGNRLAGAVFGLYQDGVRIAEATTDENGIAIFESVEFGDFEIRELYAPEGFLLTDEVFAVSVTENGEVIEITVENQPDQPDVPQTGDDTTTPWVRLAISAAAMLVVGLGLAVLHGKKKKD